MKKTSLFIATLLFAAGLQSCNKKDNLKEVVEVPLPAEKTEVPALGNPADVKADAGPFQIVALPYAYDALEPNIDAKTMEIHYSKHYLKYTNELNKAITGTELEKQSIEDILGKLDLENKAVRNNAGGYYNHTLYWEIMGPKAGGEPKGALAEAINKDFGSFEAFKTQLSDAAAKRFGSGWAWLVLDKTGKLVIGSTGNQDNPLMPKMEISGKPLLGLDVWEHAYYLKYQNKRPDYITAFFNVINWDAVAKRFEAAKGPAVPAVK
ncbi:superoxide dismutase [Flavobacterium kingsejongi]|uniref:superoxide dismutase n=1 Tax=Flavobacterium kingsejongi TaxID=1678728 RepID=A0A2S1LT44_9FLAO|nr:superoxide dismutase [Flavobacterium kingsejongi]AWG26816.1 superoxide dismutase [Flavobacterium kingsejongi]